MGRIKPAVIKRIARQLVANNPGIFSDKFEENKSVLRETVPTKRTRNLIAGHITRISKKKK